MIEFGWTYFFQIVNIIVLYLLMRRYLFEPVTNFINKRREYTEGLIDEANESFTEAKQLQEEAEAGLNEARREAQNLVEQAVEHGKTMAADIAERAKAEEATRMERATREIEEAKARAIQEVRQEVASLSVKVAEKILEQNLNREAHMHLIDDALDRMDDAHVN